MDIKSLMIGDWVKCGRRSMKVTGLAEDMYCDDIEPIPLTPEILEKNGFKWTTRKSYMVSRTDTVCMIWGFYKDCLSISDHSDDGECQISSLKCKFVHQLQQALRLCGIDKEIEL